MSKKVLSIELVKKLFIVDGLSPAEIAKKTSSSVKKVEEALKSLAVGDTIGFVKPNLLRAIRRSVDSFDTYSQAQSDIDDSEGISDAKELSAAARNARDNAQKAFDLLLLIEQHEKAELPPEPPKAEINTSDAQDADFEAVEEEFKDVLVGIENA